MSTVKPQIEESWKEHLQEEFSKPYFAELKSFLINEMNNGATVFPPGQQIFNAFNLTPFDKVKVVIIGQDPYHGRGQAHGLCFSVQAGIKPPPSLINIYKEIEDDLKIKMNFSNGNLEPWARQGVFLLNAILTVKENNAGSHANKGWEKFTDAVIKELSDKRSGLIFLLWGGYAKQKKGLIDESKHTILQSGHPSPMSANQGMWFGNKHFSKTNVLLKQKGLEEINWQIA
jgi:uracil-DNA glycosylase